MEPYLKKVDGRVVACLYCGDGFYEANSDEVSRKLCAMVTSCSRMWLCAALPLTSLTMRACAQGGMRHQRYHKGKGICSHVC